MEIKWYVIVGVAWLIFLAYSINTASAHEHPLTEVQCLALNIWEKRMKTIIAGGRDFNDLDFFAKCISDYPHPITEVVCGGAKGADATGKLYADAMEIPCVMFNAQWNQYGKAAGPIRNEQMGRYADALIAFWDGESRGTKHMIKFAEAQGLVVTIFNY